MKGSLLPTTGVLSKKDEGARDTLFNIAVNKAREAFIEPQYPTERKARVARALASEIIENITSQGRTLTAGGGRSIR